VHYSLPVIRAQFTSAGALGSLQAGPLSLLQYPASELEPGPHQVWLRFRSAEGVHAHPLTGPACEGRVARGDGSALVSGTTRGVEWQVWWEHPADGVAGWSVHLRNAGSEPVALDVVHLIDPALTAAESLRENEFYVSNYLDVQPLGEPEVAWLAVRQSMPGPRNPWMAVGSTERVVGWCTDARQLAFPDGGLDLSRDLPSRRLQGEHTLLGLQTETRTLACGETRALRFPVVVVDDHPGRTDASDLAFVDAIDGGAPWRTEPPQLGPLAAVVPTLFSPVRTAIVEDLSEEDFLAVGGAHAEGVEDGPDGAWAYWAGGRHVVSGPKERAVMRPHGHISRVSAGPHPADLTVASTAWMNGVFASQLTIGHASAAPLLSVRRSAVGLKCADGLRLFVRGTTGPWLMLGTPSAWIVDGPRVRWVYRWDGRRIEVVSTLTLRELIVEVEVVEGPPIELLVSAHADAVTASGEDGSLFADGRSRDDRWRASVHPSGTVFRHRIVLVDQADAGERGALWRAPELHGDDESIRRLNRILPSFVADAAVHYQAPRGLEQFTGGAWGTRDVSQGPVGLLLATDSPAVLRDVLLTVFSAQQTDGDWPQWFQYLRDHRAPGHRDSHGDVVYWPLLALGEYLEATGDDGILHERVSSVGTDELSPPSSILEHVEAAFGRLASRRSADPRLPAYGHGDWNDALQPASPALAASLCSTWTPELEIKALETLGPRLADAAPELADRMASLAAGTRRAFRERLLVDGELCGYSIITSDGLEPLVHPADDRTHIGHGSLQVIHAIGDELLTPEEAAHHLGLVERHLEGPTGIYLFDRPLPYHGGVTRTFLRAEAASFWGREIGLMYSHAHIRWVQALLRLGLAERAWKALQLLIPQGVRSAVPGAAARQSDCYYSSSDAGFADRYEAQEHPDRLFDPEFSFEGGWRVYSSGPGLILRILVEEVLGCRWTVHGLQVDPVLPGVFDGSSAQIRCGGRDVIATYRVTGEGHGVRRVLLDGRPVDTTPVPRRYRRGGVVIPRATWEAQEAGEVRLTIEVG